MFSVQGGGQIVKANLNDPVVLTLSSDSHDALSNAIIHVREPGCSDFGLNKLYQFLS